MSNDLDFTIKKIMFENMDGLINDVGELEDERLLISLGFNSLSFVKVIVALEIRLQIEFDDEDLDPARFTTLGNFILLVKSKLEKENYEC